LIILKVLGIIYMDSKWSRKVIVIAYEEKNNNQKDFHSDDRYRDIISFVISDIARHSIF